MVGAVAMVEAPPQPAMARRKRERSAAQAAVVGTGGITEAGKHVENAGWALRTFRLRANEKSNAQEASSEDNAIFIVVMLDGAMFVGGSLWRLILSRRVVEDAVAIVIEKFVLRPAVTGKGDGVTVHVAPEGAPVQGEKVIFPLKVETRSNL